MVHSRTIVLAMLVPALVIAGWGGESSGPRVGLLSPAELQEDFAILRRALEEAHPGLERYATPVEMNRAMADAEQALDRPQTEIEYLRVVAGVLAHVRDDHTYALPSARFWEEHLGSQSFSHRSQAGDVPLFPFFLTVADDHVYITHNNSADVSIARGTEIRAINGRAIMDVLTTLNALAPTSGFTTSRKRR